MIAPLWRRGGGGGGGAAVSPKGWSFLRPGGAGYGRAVGGAGVGGPEGSGSDGRPAGSGERWRPEGGHRTVQAVLGVDRGIEIDRMAAREHHPVVHRTCGSCDRAAAFSPGASSVWKMTLFEVEVPLVAKKVRRAPKALPRWSAPRRSRRWAPSASRAFSPTPRDRRRRRVRP